MNDLELVADDVSPQDVTTSDAGSSSHQSPTACRGASLSSAYYVLPVYALFLGSIEVITIALSIFHVSISMTGARGILLVSFVLAWRYARWLRGTDWCTEFDTAPRQPLSRFAIGVIALGALLYGYLWLIALQRPDISFDGNWYHIPNIHFWVRKGYIHWVCAGSTSDWSRKMINYMNGYPAGAELMGFILVKATGTSTIVDAANLVFLPLGVLGIALISRLFGASRSVAACCGVLYMLVPVNIVQTATTYVDVALAASMIAGMALAAYGYRLLRSGRLPWEAAPALGCACGLTLATKGTGPILAALCCAMLCAGLVLALVAADRGSRRGLLVRGVLLCLLTGCVAYAVGGYWLTRDYVIGGSPLYPIGVSFRGHQIFPGDSFERVVSTQDQTPFEMKPWPATHKVAYTWLQGMSLKNWFESLRMYDGRHGGLGYIWVFGCVPSVLALVFLTPVRWLRRRLSGSDGPALGYEALLIPLLGFVILGFVMTPNNWWARYTLWIYGLGMPAFAVAVQAALKSGWRFWGIRLWTVACVAVFLFEASYSLICTTTGSVWKLPESWNRPGRLISALVRRDGINYPFPGMEGSLVGMAIRDQTATVALYRLHPQRQPLAGLLSQPLGAREILFLDERVARDPLALRRFVSEHNVRYIICGRGPDVPQIRGPDIERVGVAPYDFRVFVIALHATNPS